jgi:hypothetical protein
MMQEKLMVFSEMQLELLLQNFSKNGILIIQVINWWLMENQDLKLLQNYWKPWMDDQFCQ